MKLPILTEAQTLGAKRPIAKGIRVNYQKKKKKRNKQTEKKILKNKQTNEEIEFK